MDRKVEIEYLFAKLIEAVEKSDLWVKEDVLKDLKYAEQSFERCL